MAGYSEAEVSAAVDQFLLREVSVGVLPGGLRDINTARDRVYDLLTTALVLRPESYFYLVWLAKNAALAAIAQQLTDIDSIIADAPGVSRAAKKIGSTTELSNARAAIVDLTAGLNARTSGVRGSLGPGVDRFRRSVTSFIDAELTKNVVVSGVVTETAAELRARVATTWTRARARHAEIESRVDKIATALSTLERVALPEATIATIVSKMSTRLSELETELAGNDALKNSRAAMLELLTMRTLLAKASTFRSPRTVLVPLTGDSAAATAVDSAGTEASTTGPRCAPFTFGPGTSLSATVNGAPVTVPFPGDSTAELRSRPITFPSGPGAGFDVAGIANLAFGFTNSFPLTSWASGAAAAAALDAVSTLYSVTFDPGTSQLVFRSMISTDASALEFYSAFAGMQVFTDWCFATYPRKARGTPITAEAVAAAVTSPALQAEVATTRLLRTTADTGAADQLVMLVASASDGVVTNGVLSSATVNFKHAGAKPGMAVVITAPVAGTYVITAVAPGSVTLASPPANATGVVFELGEDLRAAAPGTRVRITHVNPDVTGWYRVLAPGAIRVQLDRGVPTAATGMEVTFLTSFLTLAAVGTTTTSSLQIQASTGATALGFVGAQPVITARLTSFSTSVDLFARGARVNDLVTLTAPSGTVYSTTLSSVEVMSFSVATPVLYELGAWTVLIRSAGAVAFATLATAMGNTDLTPTATLDFIMSRLVNGARFAGELATTLVAYRAELAAAYVALDAYAVKAEPGITAAIRMMREQGFDRALDLLLQLDIDVVFSMPKDGVSYSTRLIRTAATAAREITPVSKYARGPTGVQEFRPTSFQLGAWHTLDAEEDT